MSASAGFGKTTLVSAWLSPLTVHNYAWRSLDKHDDDPNRFWQYLVAALRMAVPDIGDSTYQLLSATPMPPPPALLIDLINDMTDLPHRLVLALDGYHQFASRTIHEGVELLLDHAPLQLHLVLTTRADPPLSLARLRARGQLNELRQADLRFNAEEASRFLTDCMGLDLAACDIEILEKRTEGWITGLQLAAISFE